MQVSVENTGALERRLTVQVPGEEIQDKVDSKLKELTKSVRIKGFRPGRVPLSVVRQRYGKQVRLDVVNETMQRSLQQALREQDLRPAAPPVVEAEPKLLEAGDLEFSAVIEVYPELDPIDIGTIAIDRPEAEVTGNRVLIEYAATLDGERVPEEDEQRLALIVGESGFDALEEIVQALDIGQSQEAELTFPDNFREPKLAGKQATAEIKVVSVAEAELPEVDEEFVKSFGVEDGQLDTLQDEIRENLQRELKQAVNSLLKTRLIDALREARPDLEVPESIVRREAVGMASQLTQAADKEPDPALVDALMDRARARVKGGMLMGGLAQQNKIRIDATRVREAIETIANTYEQPAEVMQLYYGNQRLMEQVESSVLEEQVVDWVLENAKVTPKAMKFQEVINSATQAGRQ
jgi:trigger factor